MEFSKQLLLVRLWDAESKISIRVPKIKEAAFSLFLRERGSRSRTFLAAFAPASFLFEGKRRRGNFGFLRF